MDVGDLTNLRKSFKEYFDEPGIELPDAIKPGVVGGFEDIGTGWSIAYKLGKEESAYFLPFCAFGIVRVLRETKFPEAF